MTEPEGNQCDSAPAAAAAAAFKRNSLSYPEGQFEIEFGARKKEPETKEAEGVCGGCIRRRVEKERARKGSQPARQPSAGAASAR